MFPMSPMFLMKNAAGLAMTCFLLGVLAGCTMPVSPDNVAVYNRRVQGMWLFPTGNCELPQGCLDRG
jgi:hypothetical protein